MSASLVGGWGIATVEDITQTVAMGPFGSSIRVDTFVPQGVPVITGKHLHGSRVDDGPGFNFITDEHAERLSRANVHRGDIVMTHRGTIGQVAIVPEDSAFDRYVVSQSQFYLRCDRSRVVPEFLTLYFKSPEGQHQLLANSAQVGVPSIAQPVTYVRQLEVPLPPLDEQRAIAHVLGTLDDKIELNRRMNESLEAMARTLFRSWFVDFEPIRAKMEGRWRPGESLPGLPAHLHPLFPDRLVPSELGDIPEGWEVRTLGDVIEVNPRRSIRRGEVATHVEMAALPTSGSHVTGWTRRAFTSGSRFEQGDTLLARITPSLENGKTALVDFLDDSETAWGSTEFIVLCPRPPWPPEFAYLLARDASFREHAIVNMTGTSGRQRVPAEAVAAYQLAAPLDEAAAAFGALVRPLFNSASSASRQSRLLSAQRDTLLPRLVAGELRLVEGVVTARSS